MSSKLRMVSWILLTLVGALTVFGSLASMGVAYFQPDDQIGPIALSELTAERPDVAIALQARRGTAAAFGAGYGVLFLILTLVPYRRGDVWAWWALCFATIVVNGIILLRSPLLGTNLGLGAATIPVAVSIIALVLDVGRLKSA